MLEEQLLERSVRDGDCLRWTGAHNTKGYGHLCSEGKTLAVHRVAHEIWIGPIPCGYEVDHVQDRGCHYRDCIEPAHLEAVTRAENVRRQLARTRCPQGHELTKDNTKRYRTSKGYAGRRCRRCFNDDRRAWRERKKVVRRDPA